MRVVPPTDVSFPVATVFPFATHSLTTSPSPLASLPLLGIKHPPAKHGMDPSDYSSLGRPSPRREVHLQGPRPAPLKVSKDSHKIKKPPAAPGAGPSQSYHPPQPQQPPRAPVIIYTVSPKVIHTEPGNFMTLVQRLTGASPRTLAAAAGPSSAANQPGYPSQNAAAGELSPAARFAAVERAVQVSSPVHRAVVSGGNDIVEQLGIGGVPILDRPVGFQGILSPLPTALPPISPAFFLPPTAADPSSLAFLNEMSPLFRSSGGNTGFTDALFVPSPGNFFSTPTLPSPGFWEFLNQL